MRTTRLLGVLLVSALIGCADVTVRKVTDANDANIDGFRYYLPRPYLALKKEMPVAGDQFVVTAALGTDGNIEIPRGDLPAFLQYHFRPSTTSGGALVMSSEVGDGSLPDVLKRSAATAKDGPLTKAAAGSEGDAGPQGTVVQLGTEDMSIVYLPDFSEKYAIKYSAGLGKVDTGANGLRLRHGWMLDNISLSIDNVELGKFVFGQIDKLTDLVSLVGARKNKVLTEFSNTLSKSSAGAPGATKRVTLRITYVVMAQPGMYPILKPCEQELYRQSCCTSSGIAASPACGPTPCALEGRDWLFVPMLPFTVVPYSVRRSVSVELLSIQDTPKKLSPSSAPGLTSGTPTDDPSARAVLLPWIRLNVPALANVTDDNFVFRGGTAGGVYVVEIDDRTLANQQQQIAQTMAAQLKASPPSGLTPAPTMINPFFPN